MTIHDRSPTPLANFAGMLYCDDNASLTSPAAFKSLMKAVIALCPPGFYSVSVRPPGRAQGDKLGSDLHSPPVFLYMWLF